MNEVKKFHVASEKGVPNFNEDFYAPNIELAALVVKKTIEKKEDSEYARRNNELLKIVSVGENRQIQFKGVPVFTISPKSED